ncbi:C-type lectin domain family 4 member E-like [Myxocyprinus asiaticus]|uniref:C-type lectin domain family 4 member E-like n=1 Tax=Myxocyprinus asiaticus TaxID=70543 RepID=UPI00222215BC|nr:C-type lectin domain family 4 member E-like [Myxocyprinus asiaticus]
MWCWCTYITSNGTDWLVGCEPVTNCSDPDVEHNAKIKWILPKDTENRTAAHHCPGKNFPEKWIQHKGRFYVFSSETKNWNSSRERCQALGGDLVIINSREEQEFLARQIPTIGATLYWIGLTDSHEEGKWLWVDNTCLKDDLKFWTYNSPDDYKAGNPLGEDCVVLNGRVSAAHWGDISCLRKETSICEILCF